jgi:hypothetical protein
MNAPVPTVNNFGTSVPDRSDPDNFGVCWTADFA